jgi:hypothetical protein
MQNLSISTVYHSPSLLPSPWPLPCHNPHSPGPGAKFYILKQNIFRYKQYSAAPFPSLVPLNSTRGSDTDTRNKKVN